ncbi:SDR family NAD(P)-dependent oxidoreductase [Aerococcus vaginalis]
MKDWIVVTGASSGIGRAFAKYAAKRTYPLVLAGRNDRRLDAVAEECLQLGSPDVVQFSGDLTSPAACDQLLKTAVACGNTFALVHCAGYGDFEAIENMTYDEIADMVSVDLTATMYLSKLFAKALRKQPIKQRRIMLVASVSGLIQTPNTTVYSAVKAGVWGFANALRQDLTGTRIGVTAVMPGPVDTNFFTHSAVNAAYRDKVQHLLTDPEVLAGKMYRALHTGKHEIVVPKYYRLLIQLQGIAPTVVHQGIDAFFRCFPVKGKPQS